MFERRLYHHLDWLLVGSVLALSLIGVATIYSATGSRVDALWVPNWKLPATQLYAILIGLGLFTVCLTVDYRVLTDKSHFVYLALLALLIYVLLFGKVAGGAGRWISFKLFNLQPSEFAKIGVALVLAKFFGENRRGSPTTGDLLIAGGLTILRHLPRIVLILVVQVGRAAGVADGQTLHMLDAEVDTVGTLLAGYTDAQGFKSYRIVQEVRQLAIL